MQMNLSKTASLPCTRPSSVAAIERSTGNMANLPLDIRNDMARIGLKPAPIEVLGHHSKLDDEIAG